MKRTLHFVEPVGMVPVRLPGVGTIEIPVAQGIFKHASVEMLFELLRDPQVALKYTLEALRVAPWQVLKHFPRQWLMECLPKADLREGRRRAIEFMLS